MSGICGWSGQSDEGLDAGNILDNMEKFLGAGNSITPVMGSWGAIAGKGNKVQVAITGEVIVILHGAPTYSSAPSEDNIARVLCDAYLHQGADIMSDIHGQDSLAEMAFRDHSAEIAIVRLGIDPMKCTV